MARPRPKVTVWAPINIAVLKYWGKRNVEWNLPMTDSISITIDGENEQLGSETVVDLETTEKPYISFFINDECYTDTVGKKVNKMLKELLKQVHPYPHQNYELMISSTNYSPTAAGLASSASGYAALATALAACLQYELKTEFSADQLSSVARIGSGSACRSMYGGFVYWKKGQDNFILDSTAHQLFDEKHWPELGILILRLEYAEKDVPSTEGMQRTVETSDLSKHRYDPEYIAEKVKSFTEAIKKKDFEAFGELTMRDSNQFHALCLDSYPPISYLKPESWQVIQRVHDLNAKEGRVVAAYTFDAGPHPVIFYQRKDRALVNSLNEGIKCTAIPCKVSKGPVVTSFKVNMMMSWDSLMSLPKK